MSIGSYRWICGAAMIASACSAAVGAVRWLGPGELVQLVAPIGRAPLFVGTVGTHAVYFLCQSTPAGREPQWFWRPPNDGWSIVLGLALACASFAAFPSVRGQPLDVLVSAPFVILSSLFLIDRTRRLQRGLGQQT